MVETVRASGATSVVKLAIEFLVLTAASSGEVRGAAWAEIDTEDHVSTVPAKFALTGPSVRTPIRMARSRCSTSSARSGCPAISRVAVNPRLPQVILDEHLVACRGGCCGPR